MIINGEPCDELFPGAVLLPMIHQGIDLNTSMFKHPQGIIDYLEQGADKKFSQWFYEQTTTNIKSTDLDLNSYFDFFWWVAFNFNWVGVLLRSIRNRWSQSGSAITFRDQFFHWFNSDAYQTWALNNRRQLVSYTVGDYKKVCKDYIYDFTKDPYYHRFKIKTTSTSVNFVDHPWVAILDDWTLLTQDQMGTVLDLLPEHVEQ